MAESYQALHNRPKAIVAMRRATQCDLNNPHQWEGLGKLLANTEFGSEAEEANGRAILLFTKSEQWFALGKLQKTLGDKSEAIAAFQRAVEKERDPFWLELIGDNLAQLGEIQDAIRAYTLAPKDNPSGASINSKLKRLIAEQDKNDPAKEWDRKYEAVKRFSETVRQLGLKSDP